eukprot:13382966-Ditylum_brightwellii.AAC.1
MIAQKGQEEINQARKAILKAVGLDISVLVKAIPSLSRITGKLDDSPVHVGGMELENRFNYIFEKFISSIATPSHPI